MSRRAFIVADSMREKVRYLAGVGVPQDAIAKIIGCAPKTLRKRFRDDLDRGVAEATATIAGYLFAAARAGNIAAIIFWLKTRGQWREDGPSPQTAETAASPREHVVVYLPDNGRDPELTRVLQQAQLEAQRKYFKRKQQRDEKARREHEKHRGPWKT